VPVPGVAVRTKGWPFTARLQAWGRDGVRWRALILWEQRVLIDGDAKNVTVWFPGWCPASCVSPFQGTGGWVPRLLLPPRTADWPRPELGGRDRYLGTWTPGEELPPVPGLTIVRLPRWRDRDG
jgi:hypothetical protein